MPAVSWLDPIEDALGEISSIPVILHTEESRQEALLPFSQK